MVVSICLYYKAVGLYYCVRCTWIHVVHEHCGREKYYGERTAVDLVGAIRTVIFCPITALRQRNTGPITTRELITAALVIWSFSRRFTRLICSQHDKHITVHHTWYVVCVGNLPCFVSYLLRKGVQYTFMQEKKQIAFNRRLCLLLHCFTPACNWTLSTILPTTDSWYPSSCLRGMFCQFVNWVIATAISTLVLFIVQLPSILAPELVPSSFFSRINLLNRHHQAILPV